MDIFIRRILQCTVAKTLAEYVNNTDSLNKLIHTGVGSEKKEIKGREEEDKDKGEGEGQGG